LARLDVQFWNDAWAGAAVAGHPRFTGRRKDGVVAARGFAGRPIGRGV
jgi:hypothetical protein